MAKFPVEISDSEGIIDGLNYVLSGPSGLGQNFAGFSSYQPAWLTGNFRIPFTQDSISELYVPPISISTAEFLDGRTIKLTFSSVQPSAPFSLGNGLSVSGISGDYDTVISDYGTQIGVVQCTTTFVIIRLNSTQPILSPGTGGTVEYYSTGNFFNSTDCDARVTTTGATDRVFISAQLNNLISYDVSSSPATLKYTVAVRRFTGFSNTDPTNPDYLFGDSFTVAQKVYEHSGLSGTGTIDLIDTVFATIIDNPTPGYYRYIVEVKFQSTVGTLQVTTSEFGLRSLSAQVVKQ